MPSFEIPRDLPEDREAWLRVARDQLSTQMRTNEYYMESYLLRDYSIDDLYKAFEYWHTRHKITRSRYGQRVINPPRFPSIAVTDAYIPPNSMEDATYQEVSTEYRRANDRIELIGQELERRDISVRVNREGEIIFDRLFTPDRPSYPRTSYDRPRNTSLDEMFGVRERNSLEETQRRLNQQIAGAFTMPPEWRDPVPQARTPRPRKDRPKTINKTKSRISWES